MRNVFWVPLFVFIFFIFSADPSLAQSSYVLPYPSAMPGSILYKPNLLLARLSQYFHFGSFGKFLYNLKQADKYLVEAKTLFEYKQYLLAYNALQESDSYFLITLPNLEKAQKEGKNISQNKKTISSAAQKHIEVLTEIEKIVPEKFNWQPEKETSTLLNLKSAIDYSISIRKKYQ